MNNFFEIFTISHQALASQLSYKKQRLFLIQISFHWICLAKRTLLKFESRRLVGDGRYLEIITWGFWLSPAVSTRDPIIKPESVSSRTDNGRGLILRAMTKIPML